MADKSLQDLFKRANLEKIKENGKTFKRITPKYNLEIEKGHISSYSNVYIFRAHVFNIKAIKNEKYIIKSAPTDNKLRESAFTEVNFKREIYFYSKAYPILRKFEKQNGIEKSLIPVADYLTSDNKICQEMIVLQDLEAKNFGMKQSNLDEEHCRLIFQTLGHFHAVSFCLKSKNSKQFTKLLIPPETLPLEKGDNKKIEEILQKQIKEINTMLKKTNQNDLMKKFQKYVKNFKKVFYDSISYKDENSCLLHGDCQLSNMMFNYNARTNKVKALKLFGFKYMRVGSPVQDLAKFFYLDIDVTSQHLDKLRLFIDSYYESFSITAKKFKKDPKQLFSKNQLWEHWRIIGKSYMLLALGFREDYACTKTDLLRHLETNDAL